MMPPARFFRPPCSPPSPSRRIYDRRLKEPANFENLCFLNQHDAFQGIAEIDYGVCAGITTINWIANCLSLYDVGGKTFRTFHPKFGFPKGLDVEVAPFFDHLSVETLQAWKRFVSADGEDALARLEAAAQAAEDARGKPGRLRPESRLRSRQSLPNSSGRTSL